MDDSDSPPQISIATDVALRTVGPDLAPEADPQPGLVIDKSGRRWFRRIIRKKSELGSISAQSSSDAIEDDTQVPGPPTFSSVLDVAPTASTTPVTKNYTNAVYDIRGVTRVGNLEYTELDPSPKGIAAFEIAKHYTRARSTQPGTLTALSTGDGTGALVDTPPSNDIPFDTFNEQAVIVDPDDRYYVTPSDRYGYRHPMQVYFSMGCSATMIGRRTTLLAAHCFYDFVHGTWTAYPQTWKAGVVNSRVSPVAQWTEATTYGPYSGCFFYWIPNKYISTGSIDYDYAVVEFDCGLNPGDTIGWINLGWGTNVDYILAETTQFSLSSSKAGLRDRRQRSRATV